MTGLWQTVLGVASGALLIVIFYFAKRALTTSVWRSADAELTVTVRAKDAAELELMRVSSRMNVEVCTRIGQALKEGVTEKEIQALYIQIAQELGSPGPSFTPLICFGPNGAEPHHDSDGTRLKSDQTVIMDVGLIWRH